MPRALTIAGSDSGGGAGIQRDLKTFAALGVWGTSAVTSITSQNSLGVQARYDLPPEVVVSQIRAIMTDIGADAVKTGMLATGEIVAAVARASADHGITSLVVDPVMIGTSGDRLLDGDAVAVLRDTLVPRAAIVVPNAAEAGVLAGIEVTGAASMLEAARAIRASGAGVVIVTGGDLPGEESIDLLLDAEGEWELRGPRLPGGVVHGTGCMFSAALTAAVAQGLNTREAARLAKEFTYRGIVNAARVGKGAPAAGPS